MRAAADRTAAPAISGHPAAPTSPTVGVNFHRARLLTCGALLPDIHATPWGGPETGPETPDGPANPLNLIRLVPA
jgi:hypothetical protein